MLKPNDVIVRKIKAYDPKLYVLWNNKAKCFEIWRRMPWGPRLITPIVGAIYNNHGGQDFCPLDDRIIHWLYSSDTQRKGLERNWRWLDAKRFMDQQRKKKQISERTFRYIAADNYALLNSDFTNPMVDDSDWIKPDIKSKCNNKVCYRSADNAKKYFDGENI